MDRHFGPTKKFDMAPLRAVDFDRPPPNRPYTWICGVCAWSAFSTRRVSIYRSSSTVKEAAKPLKKWGHVYIRTDKMIQRALHLKHKLLNLQQYSEVHYTIPLSIDAQFKSEGTSSQCPLVQPPLFICDTTTLVTSSSAMAERPRELDQRFQMGGRSI